MCSFYSSRSQKCKKDSQGISNFALFGFAQVKAACKKLVKLTPKMKVKSSSDSFLTQSFYIYCVGSKVVLGVIFKE